MKKVLVLVASETNLPVIKAAKNLGCYVITCDNEPENIGHKYADEALFIDVYDTEQLIEAIAKKNIDAVLTFVSAHGLTTAASISQKFKLPGYSPKNLNVITNKDLFRKYQQNTGINFPDFQVFDDLYKVDAQDISYPAVIKPVNQGGSIGVEVLKTEKDLKNYINNVNGEYADGRFIIEQYLDRRKLLNGDCIVYKGKVIASLIGDYLFDRKMSNSIPVATLFPSKYNSKKALDAVNTIINGLKIPNGIINFEAVIIDDKAYIIEINPRPSGNFLWKLMSRHYKCDIPELCVKLSLGENIDESMFEKKEFKSHYAYQLIYTASRKLLKRKDLPQKLQESVINVEWFYNTGDEVNPLKSLYDRIGVALFDFKGLDQKLYYLNHLNSFRI